MAFQQVEIQTHRVPFGVRCVDSATRQAIRDGANISVLSTASVGRAIAGAVTPSGNFSFGRMGIRLPLDLANPNANLRDWEYDFVRRFSTGGNKGLRRSL